MNTVQFNKRILPVLMSGLLLAALLLAGPTQFAAAQTPMPTPGPTDAGCSGPYWSDGNNAPMTVLTGLRGQIYCEVDLICNSQAAATMYNTSNLNSTDQPVTNSCPSAVWDTLTVDGMATQYSVDSTWLNGPRGWTIDETNLPVWAERAFGGLNARWFVYPNLPKGVDMNQAGTGAWIPSMMGRKSTMTFNEGKPVFTLLDPNGVRWLMQAWSAQTVPLAYSDLFTLASNPKMVLPAGWQYQVITITKPITISAINGQAMIVQDALGGTYDGCYAGTCTYTPQPPKK